MEKSTSSSPTVGAKETMDEASAQQKKLKQGRLPFKPLDRMSMTPSPVINKSAGKKRKLSSPDSPTLKLKQPKVPDQRQSVEKVKPLQSSNDNEVSSSSEAEILSSSGSGGSKSGKNNLLEKFVRREDEITSTNDVIDLTDMDDNENEPDENCSSETKSPRKQAQKSSKPSKVNAEQLVRKLVFDKEDVGKAIEKSDVQKDKNVIKEEVNVIKEEVPISDVTSSPCKEKPLESQFESGDHVETQLAEKAVESVSEGVESLTVPHSGDCAEKPCSDELQESKPVSAVDDSVEKLCEEESMEPEIVPLEGTAKNASNETTTGVENASLDSSEAGQLHTTCEEEASSRNTSALELSAMEVDISVSSSDKEDTQTTSGGDTPKSRKRPLSSSTPLAQGTSDGACNEGSTPTSTNKRKSLSKRQAERAAMRQRVKDDKERQKQEAKDQKEKERLEKKLKRDEEKAEKEKAKMEEKEKKEKERQDKKEQAEKEKQEKLQQKEEEKKKRLEQLNAKSEEKRKKEEEKKQKEEQKQKEEEEKVRQAQKRKAAFTSFFLKPKTITSTKVDKTADELFIPFAVKKDMTLAPPRRCELSQERKEQLDEALQSQVLSPTYLGQLTERNHQPVRTNRILRKKKEVEQEVELLVHDSEAVKKITHAVKILKFHTDYRPPYYGTWRRKVQGLSPRNPWKKDESVFDYEVDSDEEWEEEEPGESLSDSNGEEEEGEEEDEGGEDDGWMVPHGYLSEDEGCEEDDEVTPEVLKARQRAKAQAWEAELKAKKQVAPPIHLGCFWQDTPNICSQFLDIVKDFEMVCLQASPVETLLSNPALAQNAPDKNTEKSSSKGTPNAKGCRKRELPEEAMPDLIRLVHGNSNGINRLMREFRLYWKQKNADPNVSLNNSREEDADAAEKSGMDGSTAADTSATEDKEGLSVDRGTEEPADGDQHSTGDSPQKSEAEKKGNDSLVDEDSVEGSVSKRQLKFKILAIAVREKREGNKKVCWYVNDKVLEQYKMADLSAENAWVYVSSDLAMKTPIKSGDKKPSKSSDTKTPNKEASTKTPNKVAGKIKKDRSKVTKKQTPSKSEESVSIAEGENKADSGNDCTPSKSKASDSDAVPKSNKKKPPKDQLSIMAFAKRTPQRESTEEKKENSSKISDGTDVDLESENKQEGTADVGKQGKSTNEGQSSVLEEEEDDCIMLD